MHVFKKGKFEFLALMETKMKGNGEVSWCGVNAIIAGVQDMERAREGVAILLNDVCGTVQWETLGVLALEFSELNSNFQGLKFVWYWSMGRMAPVKEIVKREILERHGQDSG